MAIGLSPVHLLLILVIAAMWLVPVVVVILIIRSVKGSRRPDPRVILDERLARGEITVEEFSAAIRALGEAAGTGRWGDGPGVPRDPPAPGR